MQKCLVQSESRVNKGNPGGAGGWRKAWGGVSDGLGFLWNRQNQRNHMHAVEKMKAVGFCCFGFW